MQPPKKTHRSSFAGMITIVKPNKDLRRNQVQPTYADRIYSLALRTAMLIALLYMQSNNHAYD